MACSVLSFTQELPKETLQQNSLRDGLSLGLCHLTTWWGSLNYCHGKTQPEKAHLRADLSPDTGYQGPWIRNTGKRFHSLIQMRTFHSFYHFLTHCQKEARILPHEKVRHRKHHIIKAADLLPLSSELLDNQKSHLTTGSGSILESIVFIS